MLSETGLAVGRFPVLFSVIRLLTCTSSFMFREVWFALESFPVFFTPIGLLICTNSLVHYEVTSRMKFSCVLYSDRVSSLLEATGVE